MLFILYFTLFFYTKKSGYTY